MNDFLGFKRKYHGKLGAYGGIDNTKIIPDGSIKEIASHISFIFDVLGKNGGLTMSNHDIPIHCPHENIEAMVGFIKNRTF